MEARSRGLIGEDFAVAMALAQPFMVYQVLMRFRSPPTDVNWTRADPILRLLPREPTLWLIPLLGLSLMIAWLVLAFPAWRAIKHGLLTGLIGAVVAGGIVALVLKLHGPRLPSFIPPEESVGPGLSLNLLAGYGEEVAFRGVLLPLAFGNLSERGSRFMAVVIACLVSGLAFALLHEAGADEWSGKLFATRFLVPGFFMSLVALLTKPALPVVGHCTAHVLIPMYFA